ncbi:exodeoxyribonuclease VII small subunit [Halanaerobium kushneri]|uniref:Exodeoxyribonuclease 7 small subunit n=1 Tax=Halanaerobium kushneri TaxID=56779 RepID=A0A1N6Q3R3_9FIRM|nr:exodeoxyribonuclease VII small subunit [Halanaerobium kushneri]SIQ11099.1 Exodeoxyribonuclease VII small subunit [Halanaerobium kushneri]
MSENKKEAKIKKENEGINREKLDFESALEKLQKIVEDLEKGGLSLDETLAEFSQGMKLLKFCHQKLDKAEKKIELMLKDDGEFTEEIPFETEIEED